MSPDSAFKFLDILFAQKTFKYTVICTLTITGKHIINFVSSLIVSYIIGNNNKLFHLKIPFLTGETPVLLVIKSLPRFHPEIPLPWREGMKGRGNMLKLHNLFTPTLALPRQRGREYKVSGRELPMVGQPSRLSWAQFLSLSGTGFHHPL